MALNISEGQFVLPGSSTPQDLARLSQTMFLRNMQNERLALAKEQKREQAGNFIENALNPEHFGTGTVYDPVINQSLASVRQQAVTLAQQGADIPTIMQQIGPAMNKISQYQMTAKNISQNVDGYLKAMHENKLDEGYKMGDLRAAALKAAFMTKGSDGNDTLADPANVNPSTNYVQKAITENPSAFTTDEALVNYAKNSPKSTRQSTVTTHDLSGNTSKRQVDVTAANWEVPEADASGKISMVPNYDHAVDNGQTIIHTAADGSDRPIRLFNEQQFDQMMNSKPAIADYIKGQVMQHLSEYKDANGKSIDLSSPSAKLLGRAIAYQMLAANGNSSVKTIQDLNKPSSAQVQIHLFGDKEQQSYDRTMGNIEAKSDAGEAGIVPQKLNTVQSLIKVFNNDPNYLDGPTAKINGVPVVDVTNKLPKAEVRFGHGEKEAYAGIYYDPAGRTIYAKRKDQAIEKIPESQSGQFFSKIAEANGVPLASVKPAMSTGGWSGGGYKSAASAPDITKRANEEAAAARSVKVNKGLTALDTSETEGNKQLKDIEVPGGKIDNISVRGALRTFGGASKYAVDVKAPDGTVQTKYFKNKEELKTFLGSDVGTDRASRAAAEYERRKKMYTQP